MRTPVTEHDLHAQISDLQNTFPRLKDHELFLVWFLQAIVTEDTDAAAAGLTGNSGDKGADAILIDDAARVVIIVQGKYRHKINKGSEHRSDIIAFSHLARDLQGTDEDFKALQKEIDPRVQQRFSVARERLKKRAYRLKLYYATTARCSPALKHEAEQATRRSNGPSDIEIFDGKRILLALSDYLDGVAPPVPSLDLPLEVGHGITSEAERRHDSKNNITSWLFSMNGSAVAQMYEVAGIRLFARNVRGFLGMSTPVNDGMRNTIEFEPSNFWYYNNGITMICDSVERRSVGGKDVMRVSNPQVINGQQTTRTLHACAKESSPASVLVRAIEVPRDIQSGSGGFDSLVSRIVAATNWQNAIRASDLMANDRRQVEIQRQLRNFNYFYLRKRQSKREARRYIGGHQRVVTKEEFAQAVAACELDPAIVREGKEGLFEEQLYSKVFPTSEPGFYLNRYRLMREVSYASKGYPERAYAKWIVLHFIWTQLAPLIRSRTMAAIFRECSEANLSPMRALNQAVQSVFRAALTFYRKNKGKGERAIDVSTFFQRRGLAHDFETYLRGPGRDFRKTFQKRWQRFESQTRARDEGYPSRRATAT